MATGLSSKQPGGVDQTFRWMLHTSGNSIATGALIGNGNGDDTALKLYFSKIGVVGATHEVTIGFTGGTDRAVTLPDADGELLVKEAALGQLGINQVKLAADVGVLGTALSAVAGFEFTPEASSTYLIEMYLLIDSTNSGHGIKLQIDGPTAQTEHLSYQAVLPFSTTDRNDYYRTDFGYEMTTGNMAEADTPQLVRVSGILKTTASTPATAVSLQIANENAASTTTIHADSVMTFTKIA